MSEKPPKAKMLDHHYEKPSIVVDLDKTIKCPICNRTLAKGELGIGSKLSIKCHSCKTICSFQVLG